MFLLKGMKQAFGGMGWGRAVQLQHGRLGDRQQGGVLQLFVQLLLVGLAVSRSDSEIKTMLQVFV